MTNQRQIEVLRNGIDAWNAWRKVNPGESISLAGADISGIDARTADLSHADPRDSNFSAADLAGADLSQVNLHNANFSGANMASAKLHDAFLLSTNFEVANLQDADLNRRPGSCDPFRQRTAHRSR